MPMRLRFRTIAALLAAAVVAGGCGGGSATRVAGPQSSSTTRADGDHDAMGGMDMGRTGGMDMGDGSSTGMAGGAPHGAMPPLHARLAAATPRQRAAAADLLARTETTLRAFASEPAARAAGYVAVDATKRVIHYRNIANMRDDDVLDPARPEGLVYFHGPTGGFRLLGAYFTVRPGGAAPTPGGDIFSWHTHDPSCGSFLVPAGHCTGTFRMLHIWTAPGAPDPWIQPITEAFRRA
jgi:hypothetical protein